MIGPFIVCMRAGLERTCAVRITAVAFPLLFSLDLNAEVKASCSGSLWSSWILFCIHLEMILERGRKNNAFWLFTVKMEYLVVKLLDQKCGKLCCDCRQSSVFYASTCAHVFWRCVGPSVGRSVRSSFHPSVCTFVCVPTSEKF